MPKCDLCLAQASAPTQSVPDGPFQLRVSFNRLQTMERQMALAHNRVIDADCSPPHQRDRPELACIQWSEKRHPGAIASCVMLDLDHIKSISNLHGRPAADAALLHFSSTLLQHVRQSDILARLGGNTFALVLPQTGLVNGCDVVEYLRRVVRASRLAYQELDMKLCFSVGITEQRAKEHLSDTLARANITLQRAKGSAKPCTRWQAINRTAK